jgi:peptidoglycan/LPS O-acetylase OafA/YrhL
MPGTLTPRPQEPSTLAGLELLRGLACIEVVLSHLPWPHDQFLNVALWTVGGWGGEAVIVFFVLSGYVIALSQERNHRPFLEFMRARFRRLLPLYLIAIAATAPLEKWLTPVTPIRDTVALHLAFLQFPPVYLFQNNKPLWSLSFEFYFYLAFALTMGRWQTPLRWLWCVLGLAAIALCSFGVTFPGFWGHLDAILAYSPIWLLGSVLIYDRWFPRFSLRQSLVLFGMVPLLTHLPKLIPTGGMPGSGALTDLLDGLLVAPLLCYLARFSRGVATPPRLGLWVVVGALYLSFAAFFLLTASWKNLHLPNVISLSYAPVLFLVPTLYRLIFRERPFFGPRVTTLSLGMGRISYAVYVIHNPLLLFAAALTPSVPLQLMVILPVIFALSWFMEYRLQPWASSWFDVIWPSLRRRGSGKIPLPA